MTREEAFALALQRFGDDAVVGVNYNYRQKFHVGSVSNSVWVKRGVGASWEEAFANVQDYPDGKTPRTHGARKAPDA